jgi:transposase
MLNGQIALLDQAVVEAAEKNERARLLMTHPGVGPITSIAFVLTMGDISRFPKRETSGQLFGADSTRVQFGWTSAFRIDQQARQLVLENAAGRSGAVRCAVRSAVSE